MWSNRFGFCSRQISGFAVAQGGDFLLAGRDHTLTRFKRVDGTETVLAGQAGFKGRLNASPANQAAFDFEDFVGILHMHTHGLILVAEGMNHQIRSVDVYNNTVSTYAGSKDGEKGEVDGPLLLARFSCPSTLVEWNDSVYVADGSSIRLICDGLVSTISGIRGSNLASVSSLSMAPKREALLITDRYAVYELTLSDSSVKPVVDPIASVISAVESCDGSIIIGTQYEGFFTVDSQMKLEKMQGYNRLGELKGMLFSQAAQDLVTIEHRHQSGDQMSISIYQQKSFEKQYMCDTSLPFPGDHPEWVAHCPRWLGEGLQLDLDSLSGTAYNISELSATIRMLDNAILQRMMILDEQSQELVRRMCLVPTPQLFHFTQPILMCIAKVLSTGLGAYMLTEAPWKLAEFSLKIILGRLDADQRGDLGRWAEGARTWGSPLTDFLAQLPFLLSTTSNVSPVLANSPSLYGRSIKMIGKRVGWREPSDEIPNSFVRLSILNDHSGQVIDLSGPLLYLSWSYFREMVFVGQTNTFVFPEGFPSSLLLFIIKIIHGSPRNYFALTLHELSFVLLHGLQYGLINERSEPVEPFIDLVRHAKRQCPHLNTPPQSSVAPSQSSAHPN